MGHSKKLSSRFYEKTTKRTPREKAFTRPAITTGMDRGEKARRGGRTVEKKGTPGKRTGPETGSGRQRGLKSWSPRKRRERDRKTKSSLTGLI